MDISLFACSSNTWHSSVPRGDQEQVNISQVQAQLADDLQGHLVEGEGGGEGILRGIGYSPVYQAGQDVPHHLARLGRKNHLDSLNSHLRLKSPHSPKIQEF